MACRPEFLSNRDEIFKRSPLCLIAPRKPARGDKPLPAFLLRGFFHRHPVSFSWHGIVIVCKLNDNLLHNAGIKCPQVAINRGFWINCFQPLHPIRNMHERLLHYADNQVAMVALKSAKAGLISSKHIVASKEVPLEGDDQFIEEHLSILESLHRQNTDESGLGLQAHLLKSRRKVQDRLRQFRKAVEIRPQKFAKRIY